MPNGTHSEVTSRMLELNHRLSSTNVRGASPGTCRSAHLPVFGRGVTLHFRVGWPLGGKKTLVTVKGKDFNIFFYQQITKNFNHLGFNQHLCRTMKNVSNHVLLNQLKSVSPRLRGFGFEHFEHTTGQHLGTPCADSCKKIPRYASRPTSWSQCEISQPKSRLRGGKPGDMQRMQWTTGSPEWPRYDL